MSEIINENRGDASQYPNKARYVEGDSSEKEIPFNDEFDSTFSKLEAMQEEIMSKRIADLEELLSEIEAFASSIINAK